jgi:hypothetical protein
MTPAEALFDLPICGLYPLAVDEANRLLQEWGHRLGPVHRPFRQEAYCLRLAGQEPLAIAVSGSIIDGPVAGYDRQEVVELTRLAARNPWANRVMLRLWREVCAPLWKCWPVRAAVSYSHNAMHRGNLYRLDGWERVRDDCGNPHAMLNRGKRSYIGNDPRAGRKTLWVWRYAEPLGASSARQPDAHLQEALF